MSVYTWKGSDRSESVEKLKGIHLFHIKLLKVFEYFFCKCQLECELELIREAWREIVVDDDFSKRRARSILGKEENIFLAFKVCTYYTRSSGFARIIFLEYRAMELSEAAVRLKQQF